MILKTAVQTSAPQKVIVLKVSEREKKLAEFDAQIKDCGFSLDDAVAAVEADEEEENKSSEAKLSKVEDEASPLTEQETALRDAIVDVLRKAGIEVSVDAKEGQKVLDMANSGATLSKAQKRALETASVISDETHQPTVVSSADGAKVLKKLESLAGDFEKLSNTPKYFLGEVAKALGAVKHGSNSEYATFETKNGNIVTIRLANHNARVSTFDNHKENDGISIVVSAKGNNGLVNDGDAHVTEYYYDAIKLRRANGKPLAEIIHAIQQALYSGYFNDPTGIAERQEVNAEQIRMQRVYHGSGADFDAFDHSHMGEGEGAQAYGWGTYVTEVEGIGKTYAKAMGRKGYKTVSDDIIIDVENDLDTPLDFSMSFDELVDAISSVTNYNQYFDHNGGWRDKMYGEMEERYGLTTNDKFDYIPNKGFWFRSDDLDENFSLAKKINEKSHLLDESAYDFEDEDDKESFIEEISFEIGDDIDKWTNEKDGNAAKEYLKDNYGITEKDFVSQRILYTVEIPDDNGSNYIDWEKTSVRAINRMIKVMTDEQKERIAKIPVQQYKVGDKIYDMFDKKDIKGRILWHIKNGWGNVYEAAEAATGDAKSASELLSRAGFVGIKYPAQYQTGGRKDGASNYVIFNEKDAKITDKVRFFRTPNGQAFGYTINGKIYLDPRIATAETPIHEYSHLWTDALRTANPEAWEHLKQQLLGNKGVTDVVKKLYPELEGDDLMDEVFQHFAGKRGAERLREEQRKQEEAAKDKSTTEKIKAAFAVIRKTLSDFWQQTRDLFAGNNKNLANLSAEDFADMMLNDLLNGFNPKSNKEGIRLSQTQDNPFVTNRKAKELANIFRTWSLEEMGETVENYVFNHPTIKEALGNREASDIYDYLTTLNEKEYKRLTSGRFYYPVPSYDDFLSMDKEEAIDEVDEFKELVIDNFINDRMTDVDWVKKNMPELVNSVRFDEDTTPTGEARKALGVDEETGIDTGSAYIDEDALENANKGVMFSKKDKTSYAPTGIARSRFSKAEIQVSPSEYAQISHQIETYPNKKFRGLVFTANNFYLCDVRGAGNFRVLMEMPIEGNEDLIDYIHKNYGKNNSRIVESNADIDGRLQDARISSRSRVSNNSSVEREQFSNSRLGGVDTSSEANGRRGDAKTVRTLEGQSEANNAAMTEAANSAAEELHTPVTVIGTEEELDALAELSDREKKAFKRNANGMYSIGSGKVYVYLPNCTDADEVKRIVLHEVVGHKGLRQLLGEQGFHDFCFKLYSSLPKSVRDVINRNALTKYSDIYEAMDEYLADEAEKDKAPTWWQKAAAMLRQFIRERLNIDIPLSINDAKYILWQSKNQLQQGNIISEAQHISMRRKLGINQKNDSKPTPPNGGDGGYRNHTRSLPSGNNNASQRNLRALMILLITKIILKT